MKKTLYVIVVSILLAFAATVHAKPVKIAVSQFVEHPSLNAVLWGFKDHMKQKGVKVIYKEYSAHGKVELVGQIAAQIASDKPDLILAIATPSAQACAKIYAQSPQLANTPMLFSAITDPLAAGLVKDYNHPELNITGVSDQMPMDKNLDMILRFLPDLKKIGVIYSGLEKNSAASVKRLKEAAIKHKITVVEAPVTYPEEVNRAAQGLVGKVDAVYIPLDNTIIAAIDAVVQVSEKNRLPLFSADNHTVKRGAIAALSFDYFLHGEQTAAMARKILKGKKNAKVLPVEFQKEFSFTINPKAAERIGLVIDKSLLDSADALL